MVGTHVWHIDHSKPFFVICAFVHMQNNTYLREIYASQGVTL